MKYLKYITFTFIFILLISFGFAVNAQATDNYNNLKVIGITVEDLGATDLNVPATRKELAYFASKLADGKIYTETTSTFTDVSGTTKFKDYIANFLSFTLPFFVRPNLFAAPL